jgi:hypothetical protein
MNKYPPQAAPIPFLVSGDLGCVAHGIQKSGTNVVRAALLEAQLGGLGGRASLY